MKSKTPTYSPASTSDSFLAFLHAVPLPAILVTDIAEIRYKNKFAESLFLSDQNLSGIFELKGEGQFCSWLNSVFQTNTPSEFACGQFVFSASNVFVYEGENLIPVFIREASKAALHQMTEQLNRAGGWKWMFKENSIEWTDGLYKILGLDKSVEPGLIIEYAHPDDKATALRSVEDAYNDDASHLHRFRVVKKDLTECLLETITEVIRDDAGKTIGLVGVVTDVSSRINSLEKSSEIAFIKLLNAAAAASNMAETVEEAALACIRHICEFSGIQMGQLYLTNEEGQLKPALVRHADNSMNTSESGFPSLFNLDVRTALAERAVSTRRLVFSSDLLKNENAFTMLNARRFGLRAGFAFPILLRHEVIGVLEFFSTQVIKEDPQLLQVVSFIGTHLGRVEERRRARHELKQAKEKAEVSEKAKEQFLANISHEIRTPLNGIIGFTNLLTETALNPQQKKYLSTVRHSTENLLEIVNSVLDLSKVETGMLTLEETTLDLHKVINKTAASIRPKLRVKKLGFKITIGKSVPRYVIGDPLRLSQVLLNLLSNAVKFTKKGKINLDVDVTDSGEEIVSVKFVVEDTGIGIPADKLENIFESFTQASSDTTRKFGGTGLGLTIAKQLVELQCGLIHVRSEVNKGSAFEFFIPFKKSQQAPKKISKKKSESQKMLNFTKVLVVEDNLVNRQLMRRLLENNGMEVETATNGKIAVEKIKKQRFDLVLMDLQMPVMDGFEATRKIRTELNNSAIPIIALTAHALQGESEKCRNAGMNDYLSKPLDVDLLFSRINKYVYNPPLTVASVNSEGKQTDLTSLRSMMKNNKSMITEMSQLFMKNTPPLLKKLSDNIAAQRFNEVTELAHKLRSSVKILGMNQCDAELLRIENEGKKEQPDCNLLSLGIEKVKEQCRLAVTELKEELKSL